MLLLYSYEREFAPHKMFAETFRPELGRSSPQPIDFVEVSLQDARSSRNAPGDADLDRLRSAFGAGRFDLVVTIGGPAATFAQKFRPQLFAGTPMLLADVDRRFVQQGMVTGDATVVAVEHHPSRMVEQILALLPDTRTVVVVIGASQLEQFWLREVKQEFRPFADRLTFIWTDDLSFAQLVKRCATLPSRSAIFYGMLSLDARGQPQVEERTLSTLHTAANAPMFGLHSPQLGRGIVGGPLLSIDDLSRNTTRAALRILNGESPRSIVTPIQVAGTPVFDWRELRRWGIEEARLPQGSLVQFREPSPWQRYRRPIVAAVAVAAVQMLAVIALVFNLVQQRRTSRGKASEALGVPADGPIVSMWSIGPNGESVDRPVTGSAGESGTDPDWIASVHPEDIDRCLEMYRRAFARREPFQMEYRIRRGGAEYSRVLDTGVPRFSGETFAGYVGAAIDVSEITRDRTALSSLSRRLMNAQERERASVAKKVREDICQRMIGLTLRLHSLRGGLSDDGLHGEISELSDKLSGLAGEMLSLSDPVYQKIETLGLPAVAATYCHTQASQHGVFIDFRQENVPAHVPNDVALALFRVLQEALENALSHAAVRDIWVSLRGSDEEIRLEVSDLGIGFDVAKVTSSQALGVIAMRERVALVDGELTVDSRPGQGTRILARAGLRRRPR